MTYNDNELLGKMESLPEFVGFPDDYHLILVRKETQTPNVFEDKCYLFKNKEFVLATTCTTRPGTPALLGGWKKVNKKGAAVIKSNQIMYKAFSYGLHNGKMPALRQVKPILTYSDNNNNSIAEELGTPELIIRNTNFHYNSYNGLFDKVKAVVQKLIGAWSYGCMVSNVEWDYEKIIGFTKGQKFVTITILKEF